MYNTCMYEHQHIVCYFGKGHKPHTITRLLREDGLTVSRRGVSNCTKYMYMSMYIETVSIASRAGSGQGQRRYIRILIATTVHWL